KKSRRRLYLRLWSVLLSVRGLRGRGEDVLLEGVVRHASYFHARLLLRVADGVGGVAAKDAVSFVVKVAKLHQALLQGLHGVAARAAGKTVVVDGRLAHFELEVGLLLLTADVVLDDQIAHVLHGVVDKALVDDLRLPRLDGDAAQAGDLRVDELVSVHF